MTIPALEGLNYCTKLPTSLGFEHKISSNSGSSENVELMLAWRLRRWTLIPHLVSVWISLDKHQEIGCDHGCSRDETQCWLNVGPPSSTVAQHWANIGLLSPVCWGCSLVHVTFFLQLFIIWLIVSPYIVSHHSIGSIVGQRHSRWTITHGCGVS